MVDEMTIARLTGAADLAKRTMIELASMCNAAAAVGPPAGEGGDEPKLDHQALHSLRTCRDAAASLFDNVEKLVRSASGQRPVPPPV